jgi:hypothetical protein
MPFILEETDEHRGSSDADRGRARTFVGAYASELAGATIVNIERIPPLPDGCRRTAITIDNVDTA